MNAKLGRDKSLPLGIGFIGRFLSGLVLGLLSLSASAADISTVSFSVRMLVFDEAGGSRIQTQMGVTTLPGAVVFIPTSVGLGHLDLCTDSKGGFVVDCRTGKRKLRPLELRLTPVIAGGHVDTIVEVYAAEQMSKSADGAEMWVDSPSHPMESHALSMKPGQKYSIPFGPQIMIDGAGGSGARAKFLLEFSATAEIHASTKENK